MDRAQQPQTLPIRVTPRSAVNAVVGWADAGQDTLLLRVTAPATEGKANEAVVKLLAAELGIPKSAVSITRGETSRNKLVTLDIAAEKLEIWLKMVAERKSALPQAAKREKRKDA